MGRLSHHIRERDIERFFRSEGKIREVLMKDGFAFVEFDHTEDAEAAVRHLNGRDINGERVHVEFAKGSPRGRESRGVGSSLGRGMSRNGPYRDDRGRDRGYHGSGSSGRGGSGGGGGISYAEKYGPPRNTDYRIIVENLSSRVSWQDLKDLMRQAGEVTFADAHKRERNMGIVDFASFEDMQHAIDTLNDTEFHGRRIKVYEGKSRRHSRSGVGGGNSSSGGLRRNSRSRSRSKGRYSSSRSRSRDRAPVSRSKSRSRSRSKDASPAERSPSRSQSRSRSPSRSRSRSRSTSANSNKSRRSSSPGIQSDGPVTVDPSIAR